MNRKEIINFFKYLNSVVLLHELDETNKLFKKYLFSKNNLQLFEISDFNIARHTINYILTKRKFNFPKQLENDFKNCLIKHNLKNADLFINKSKK